MFRNLAQFCLFGIGRAQQPRSTIQHRIDDHSNDHFAVTAHRSRRPTLVCRWQKVPSTGGLECVWQAVPRPTANTPRPMRLVARAESPAEADAADEAPLLRPAA
jgi:hypothetical protein